MYVAERASRHQRLVRKVRSHLNSDEVQDSEDGELELLQGLNGLIDGWSGPGVTGEEAIATTPSIRSDYSDNP